MVDASGGAARRRGLDPEATSGYASALRCPVPPISDTPRPSGDVRARRAAVVAAVIDPGPAVQRSFRSAGKDPSWLPRAPLLLRPPTPSRTEPPPPASPSPRSTSPSVCRTSSVCRPRASTGSWATRSGRRVSPSPPRPGVRTSRTPPVSRRSSRRSRRSRTSARRCPSPSPTTASSRRSTRRTSARRRTSPTPRRSSSPPSSSTTRPVRSRARPSSWATSRS